MLEMICSIPENIGWTLVGALSVCTLFALCKLVETFVGMWKEYHEEEAAE